MTSRLRNSVFNWFHFHQLLSLIPGSNWNISNCISEKECSFAPKSIIMKIPKELFYLGLYMLINFFDLKLVTVLHGTDYPMLVTVYSIVVAHIRQVQPMTTWLTIWLESDIKLLYLSTYLSTLTFIRNSILGWICDCIANRNVMCMILRRFDLIQWYKMSTFYQFCKCLNVASTQVCLLLQGLLV